MAEEPVGPEVGVASATPLSLVRPNRVTAFPSPRSPVCAISPRRNRHVLASRSSGRPVGDDRGVEVEHGRVGPERSVAPPARQTPVALPARPVPALAAFRHPPGANAAPAALPDETEKRLFGYPGLRCLIRGVPYKGGGGPGPANIRVVRSGGGASPPRGTGPCAGRARSTLAPDGWEAGGWETAGGRSETVAGGERRQGQRGKLRAITGASAGRSSARRAMAWSFGQWSASQSRRGRQWDMTVT